MLLKLFVLMCFCVSALAQTTTIKPSYAMPDTALSGDYMATVTNVVGWRFRVVLHVSAYPSSPVNVYYDLPEMGKFNVPFTNSALEDSSLVLANENEGIRFEGVVKRQEHTIEGQWISAKANSNVVFSKLMGVVQLDSKPTLTTRYSQPLYPINVSLTNRTLGKIITSSIITPDTSNAYPMIVIMGEGALANSDEQMAVSGGHAIARYSVPNKTTVTNEAELVAQFIRHCIDRSITTSGYVVLVAHNQKGAVAALVCNELNESIRSVICINTPAKKGADYLPVQIAYHEERSGTPQIVTDAMRDMVTSWLNIVQAQPDTVISTAMILQNVDSTVSSRPDLEEGRPDLRPLLRAGKISYIQSSLIPWLQSYINYQPELLLRSFPVPTLVILGDASEQLPIQYQADAWQKITDINRKVQVEQFAQINFYAQRCIQCTPQEEQLNRLSVDNAVLERILEWAR